MAANIPKELKEIADQVNEGIDRYVPVRILLAWFDAQRRGYRKVREIRKALRTVNLITEPDFEEAWIGANLQFVKKLKVGNTAASSEAGPVFESKIQENGDSTSSKPSPDASSRIKIGMLDAANRSPLCISPDAKVVEATTLMKMKNYSQLPVSTNERDIKGIISWKSLGSRLALGMPCNHVRECMERPHYVRSDASLFEAIQQIVEHDWVLVIDHTRKLTGIVTTADLSLEFAKLGEPFLLIGEIENHIRNFISDKYPPAELNEICNPGNSGPKIEDVADLSFGGYVRLLENPDRWVRLAIQIDRKVFIEKLKQVGSIRNDVMHFDPDGIEDEDLATVREFALFLSGLENNLC